MTIETRGAAAAATEGTELDLVAVELDDGRDMVELFDEVAHLPHSCFLDSSMLMDRFGRYSFIGFDPYLVLIARDGRARFERRGAEPEELVIDPFAALRRSLAERKLPRRERLAGLPPFLAGGIGFLSYELGHYVERLPASAEDDLGLPELGFCFFDRVVAHDAQTGTKWLIASAPRGGDLAAVEEQSLARLTPGAGAGKRGGPPVAGGERACEFTSGFTREEYLAAVRAVKEHILAGDIFQANLSQRFSAPLLEPAWDLYRRLRVLNAAPFSAYLGFGDFALASSSPERFLKVDGRGVETRPIKGTRPRSDDPAEDETGKRELLESAKDRAELSMIVDLQRSDLGKVCSYGSVTVDEHAVLESYATVHHLVSTVSGELREDKDVIDLLRACWPGGSITGAPKIRSMEVIDELEPTARGVYTGSIGYLGFDGTHDLNIAIRTMIITGGRAFFQVGGGIVADSDPEAEFQETLDKGKALFGAVMQHVGPGSEPRTPGGFEA